MFKRIGRDGVLARIDAALTELGHDPQNLSPETLETRAGIPAGMMEPQRRTLENG